MLFDDNEILIFNPKYRIKNDLDRQILYSIETSDSKYIYTQNWKSTIHPFFGYLFNLFCSGLTFGKVCEILCKQFNISKERVIKLLIPYIENNEEFYTEYKEFKIYFPKNLIVRNKNEGAYSNNIIPQIETYEGELDKIDLKFDRFRKAPTNILFVLTTSCPVNCAYCYCDKNTIYNPLNINQIFKIIDEAYQLHVSYIDLVGGEIFSHPYWDIIIKKLVELNMSPHYISTKTPITSKILTRLLETGYKGVIQLSLDSLSSDILKKTINAWPNYLDEFINGIHMLEKNNFRIQVNTILSSLNCNTKEIDSLYAFINSISKLEYWEIRVATDSLYPSTKWENIKPDSSNLKSIFKYIKKNILPFSNINILLSDNALTLPKRCVSMGKRKIDGGVCGMLQDRMVILPDGKVTACEELYWHPTYIIGDLNRSSILEVWQSKEVQNILNPNKSTLQGYCKKCLKFSECTNYKNRCPVKIIRAYGHKNYGYPDPRCQYAPSFDQKKYL